MRVSKTYERSQQRCLRNQMLHIPICISACRNSNLEPNAKLERLRRKMVTSGNSGNEFGRGRQAPIKRPYLRPSDAGAHRWRLLLVSARPLGSLFETSEYPTPRLSRANDLQCTQNIPAPKICLEEGDCVHSEQISSTTQLEARQAYWPAFLHRMAFARVTFGSCVPQK